MKMRVAASVAVTTLTAVALSGCMFVTPQQTTRSYTPSDGVNGHVGDVLIRNVFLVSRDGTTASMIGVLANDSATAQPVTVQYATTSGTDSVQVTVPANGLLSLRTSPQNQSPAAVTTEAQAVVLSGISAPLGGLYTVGFEAGSAKPVSLQVPVLTGSLDDYQTLYPTLSPSPSPTPSPTAS